MHGRLGRGSSITVPRDRPLPLFCCSISFVGVDNLRDVRHGVGAAHDGQVDAERHLRARVTQPLRDHVKRDPHGGQQVTGGTVPEAMSPGSLAPGPRRLLIRAGMLDAGSQVPQGRLPGPPDNDIPWTIRGGE